MAIAARGEITAILDGKPFTLCLTLGALASLEESLGAQNLSELAGRFASGTLTADALIKVLAAGLKGGGHDFSEGEVAAMKAEGGAAAFVDIAARLLDATFTPLPESET